MFGDLFKPPKTADKTPEAEAKVHAPSTASLSVEEITAPQVTDANEKTLESINQALDDIETEIKSIITKGATVDIYDKSVIINAAIKAARDIVR
ncbi:hypothetical protein [Pseudochelatococcus sp. G4_1912]|uniref:hypothetical protein n=1 Tax=Pseudochelatococcus sp. G4_1912 TaxID=3114288 RepID=UPI0039C6D4F2